jgi:hypothetical protein
VETTVNKQQLLKIIRENRDKHRGVFEEALLGFRLHAVKVLDEKIAALRDGRSPEIRIVVSRPEDHTPDYDRVIRMLEMDTGQEFTLSEERFAQYVMDDWSWKRDWLRMSNRYAAGATRQAYGVEADED